MSIGSDFTGAVGTSGSLLQGASDTEQKNKQLDFEKTTSGLNYLKDASGKAIDFMTQINSEKANLMKTQMQQEGENARTQMKLAGKQQEDDQKTQAEKAKHDYENFMTITPELADGVFKSTNGKMDFRKQVGSRVLTKAFIPLVAIAAHDAMANDRSKNGGGKNSSKDLNALKAFTSEYDKKKKDFEDPLKANMAARDPQLQSRRAQDEKWLNDNQGKYNEAVSKTGEIGGLSGKQDDTVTPPATAPSDIDALIDSAFK